MMFNIDGADLAAVLGVALITYGGAEVYAPLATILPGLFLFVIGLTWKPTPKEPPTDEE